MERNELIKRLKNEFGKTLLKKDDLDDVANFLVDKIEIPLEYITDVLFVEYFNYNIDTVDGVNIEVSFDTKSGRYTIEVDYTFSKPKNIKLTLHVLNAINNFTQWGGDFHLESAYLKGNEIMLTFEEDDLTDCSLKEHMKYIKELLISYIDDNCSEWTNNNVERWNEYAYYVLPTLRVLDEIEKGVKLYY